MSTLRSPNLAMLIVMTMCNPLALNMFLPALPDMAEEFGVSYARMSMSISVYLGATAVLALIIGPVSDRIGRRPTALAVTALFALTSVVAALADSFTVFLLARVGQAVMVGGFILASAIVRDTRDPGAVAPLLATMSAAMALAPLLAPMIGGFVVEFFGWRAVFWIYAAIGAALTLAGYFDISETRIRDASTPKAPARALLLQPYYWVLVGIIAFSVGGFYGFLAGAPLVGSAIFDLPSRILGIALGSITIGFLFGSAFSARATRAGDPLKIALWGRIFTASGLALGVLAAAVWPTAPLAVFVFTVFIGVGNGLTIPNINAQILNLRKDMAGTAMGVASASFVGTGAIITLAMSAVLSAMPSAAVFVSLLLGIAVIALVLMLLALRMKPG